MSANVVKPQQSPYYARIPWIMEIRKEFVLPGTRKTNKKKMNSFSEIGAGIWGVTCKMIFGFMDAERHLNWNTIRKRISVESKIFSFEIIFDIFETFGVCTPATLVPYQFARNTHSSRWRTHTYLHTAAYTANIYFFFTFASQIDQIRKILVFFSLHRTRILNGWFNRKWEEEKNESSIFVFVMIFHDIIHNSQFSATKQSDRKKYKRTGRVSWVQFDTIHILAVDVAVQTLIETGRELRWRRIRNENPYSITDDWAMKKKQSENRSNGSKRWWRIADLQPHCFRVGFAKVYIK